MFKTSRIIIILETGSVIILLTLWIFVFQKIKTLPQVIPIHFGSDGTADGFGDRNNIFELPKVGLALYIVLSFFSGVILLLKLSKNSKLEILRHDRTISWLKFLMLLSISFISFFSTP